MPSLEHEGFVDLFRENLTLAPRLLSTLFGYRLPPYSEVTNAQTDLTQLVPVQFLADLVLEVKDAAGKVVLAIVVEAQRFRDPDKLFSWLVYVALLRARHRCPTVVLVVTPDEAVARWARKPVDLGFGLGTFRPVVLGPAEVPEITDPAVARADPELAVLSAIAHGSGPRCLSVLTTALVALGTLDDIRELAYYQIIYNGLVEPMQKALDAMQTQRISEELLERLPTIRKYMEFSEKAGEAKGLREGEAKGLREGEAKGLREGEARGLREGEARARRESLVRLLARAGIAITDEHRARIEANTDVAELQRWIENVIGATSAEDVFR